MQPPARLFNPSSPFAFEPPAYDSLPKDPPKYADICQGEDNAAFVNETRIENTSLSTNNRTSNIRSENLGPPSYSEQEERSEQPDARSTEERTFPATVGAQNTRSNVGDVFTENISTTATNSNSSGQEESSQAGQSGAQLTSHSPRIDSKKNSLTSGRSKNTSNVNNSNSADATDNGCPAVTVTTNITNSLATVDIS